MSPLAETPERRSGEPGAPLLQISHLTKRFGSTTALEDLSLRVDRGEIVALLGENGAGKSTTIKIMAGLYEADQGSIAVEGESLSGGADPEAIAFVHQDLGLVADMTVAENIALTTGYACNRAGLVRWGTVRRDAGNALERLEVRLDVKAPVSELNAAERSFVAIARALAQDARILVLDEPTATMGPREAERLLEAVERLSGEGLGIIYVTHRLDEVFRVADRAEVLRNGRLVASVHRAEFVGERIVHAITGREIEELEKRRGHRPARPTGGEELVTLRGVVTDGAGPVDVTLRSGEVCALTGLAGAGQHAVAQLLRGIRPLYRGRVETERGSFRSGRRIDLGGGVAFTPGKRAEEGIAPELTLRENLFPNGPVDGEGSPRPASPRTEASAARKLLARYAVRPLDSEAPILTLSGGNQQKVVIARALSGAPRLIVLEDPTMGVDVGAKVEIYRFLEEAAAGGAAVVVVTADLEEVEIIADRAVVFRSGRTVGELTDGRISQDRLLALAGGIDDE